MSELDERTELLIKHKINNYLQEIGWSKADSEGKHKLLLQSQQQINKEISEIKSLIKDFNKENKELYAPRAVTKEVDQNRLDIKDLYKNINGIHIKIAMASGGWAVIMYFISNL